MTEQHDRGDASRSAVAWLVCDGGAVPSVFPLDRQACVELTRGVLAGAAVHVRAEAFPPTPRRFAATVPGLAAWMERIPAAAGGMQVAFLAASLVLPGDERSAGLPGGAGPTAEADVLREAVRVAAAETCLREEFDRAVAAARIEAMRELAYGAGHEINNPLANIATRAQALLLEETHPERRRRLSTIVDQAFRARDMIGGLMVFARPPKPRREPVDVAVIAAAAIEAVRGQAASWGVRLEYSPLPTPHAVLVDRVQVEEAVRALLVNALEAAAAGGRVVVRVSHALGDLDGGCQVSVEDNGRGMTLDQVKRAFDPFYSGREAGRGAGMGLPKAWRLIESSGGDVLIDSRPGHGTRVLVRLPGGGGVSVPPPSGA